MTSQNDRSNGIDAEPLENGSYDHIIGADADQESLIDSEYRLLVPVIDESTIEDVERLMETAATIACDRGGTLLVLSR